MLQRCSTLFIILLVSIFCSTDLIGQEICDNGIDDDGDGLIDLNDEDCACPALIPSGLIPNPSFEDMSCCPNDEGELDCAVTWIQASRPTTDYVHTCGVLGNPFLGKNAPLPFPDGEGGIGFRDGKPGNADFKEYAGACLNMAMEVGVDYKLDFFVGFPTDPDSRELNLGVFVTTNCNNLPFGNGDNTFGCPTNGPGWTQLGEILVVGENEWVNVIFDFTADQAYSAIVLGPACAPHPIFSQDPYFFMDRLTLAEKNKFGVPFAEITGSICEDDLTLVIEGDLGSSYQWYFNGIAIPDETGQMLLLEESPDVEGTYSAVITQDDGCFDSQDYVLTIPSYSSTVSASICDGEVLPFGTQILTEEGTYEEVFFAADGCDSTVLLDLAVLENTSEIIEQTICDGDTYTLFDIIATETGSYSTQISNIAGCDSMITVLLDVVPANEGILLDPLIELELGDIIDINPSFTDPDMISYQWTSTNSNLILSEERALADYQAIFSETLILSGIDNNGCPALDSVEIRVNNDVEIYIPNVFSPNNDGNNDNFSIGGTRAVTGIQSITIYDRWGNLVYSDNHVGTLESYEGWNGRFDDQNAAEGVYTYLVLINILGNQSLTFSGNLTLLR
jgi:gliding motility-associated-like protein